MSAPPFPFSRVVVADTSSAFDFDLVRYGASLAFLHPQAELVVLSRATCALQSFAASPTFALSAGGVGTAEKVTCRVLVEPDLDGLFGSVRDLEADLMIVRSPQTSSRGRVVSRRLAFESPCSLCLVPHGSQPGPKCVVAGIKPRETGVEILRAAAMISRAARAFEFIAVHTWSAWTMDPTEAALDPVRESEWLELFRFIERVDLAGVDCTPRVEESSRFSTGVLRVARERGADLVVAAAPDGRPSWLPDRRPDEEELLLRSSIPLLLLRLERRQSLRHLFTRLFRGSEPTFG